jgi:hypothetical protein
VGTGRLVHAQQHLGAKAGLQARARLAGQLRDALDADIMQALDRRGRQPQRTGRLPSSSEARPDATTFSLPKRAPA